MSKGNKAKVAELKLKVLDYGDINYKCGAFRGVRGNANKYGSLVDKANTMRKEINAMIASL